MDDLLEALDAPACQPDAETLQRLYEIELKSIPDIARELGLTRSTARARLLQAGIRLRARADAIRLAGAEKLGSGLRGKKRVFTQEWKDRIRDSKLAHGDKHAKGVTHKKNGYVEITRGEHKFRSVHVITVEKRIGRKLARNEVVHHDDEDRANNSDANLILMTRSEHTRLHQERRKRDRNGRQC